MIRATEVWALTGGVASGKSTACGLLESLVPGTVRFDADRAVARLLDGDAGVREAVAGHFGESVVAADGGLDRAALRARVFGSGDDRRMLERLLHPRVREDCLESLAAACKMGAPVFLAEIPLLFESDFDFGQRRNLLVAVGRETQWRRLGRREGVSAEMARAILSAQWPTERKIARADAVFWNEGPRAVLRSQLSRFSSPYHHE
jgi:dephospho-CoA kinase